VVPSKFLIRPEVLVMFPTTEALAMGVLRFASTTFSVIVCSLPGRTELLANLIETNIDFPALILLFSDVEVMLDGVVGFMFETILDIVEFIAPDADPPSGTFCGFKLAVVGVDTPVTFTLVCDSNVGLPLHENLAVILLAPGFTIVYVELRVKFHLE
jgi:hypothetical protein